MVSQSSREIQIIVEGTEAILATVPVIADPQVRPLTTIPERVGLETDMP